MPEARKGSPGEGASEVRLVGRRLWLQLDFRKLAPPHWAAAAGTRVLYVVASKGERYRAFAYVQRHPSRVAYSFDRGEHATPGQACRRDRSTDVCGEEAVA